MSAKLAVASRPPLADRCPVCSAPLWQPETGRKRRFCTPACKQKAYRGRGRDARRDDLVTLVEGDATHWLASLPSESVDLAVTDPPYFFDRRGSSFKKWFEHTASDDVWPTVFGELYRVLAANAHCLVFCDEWYRPIFESAAKAVGFEVKRCIVWDKCKLGMGTDVRAQHEFILDLEKGRREGNFRNVRSVQRYPGVRGRDAYPTEKPVDLLSLLIRHWSAPGDTVIDPFCGSGNVGRAARESDRKALLCDLDPSFAARRLRLVPVPFEQVEA